MVKQLFSGEIQVRKVRCPKTLQENEPSSLVLCDAEYGNLDFTLPPPTQQESHNTGPKDHGNQLTKYALRKDQHRFYGPWNLLWLISFTSQQVILQMDLSSVFWQCHLISFGIVSYSDKYSWKSWKKHCNLWSLLMSHLTMNYNGTKWTLLWGTLSNEKQQTDISLKHFMATLMQVILRNFWEGTQNLHYRKLVQISIGGPNVIWKLYDSIVEEMNENYEYPGLIDVGSYSHHVVHGAFKKGYRRQDGILMQCWKQYTTVWWLSSKKEDYRSITWSGVFPLLFCIHRWI